MITKIIQNVPAIQSFVEVFQWHNFLPTFLFSYNDWYGTEAPPSYDWWAIFPYLGLVALYNYLSKCSACVSPSRFTMINLITWMINIGEYKINSKENYFCPFRLTGWLLYCDSRSSISRFLSFFAWSHKASHATTSIIL